MGLEYILVALTVSLFLTLLLEIPFALILGVRGRSVLFVFLANILTNPAVIVLHLLLCLHFIVPEILVVPILEAGAVLTEALIYSKYTDIKRPFLFSLGANLFSYFLGAVIGTLI